MDLALCGEDRLAASGQRGRRERPFPDSIFVGHKIPRLKFKQGNPGTSVWMPHVQPRSLTSRPDVLMPACDHRLAGGMPAPGMRCIIISIMVCIMSMRISII